MKLHVLLSVVATIPSSIDGFATNRHSSFLGQKTVVSMRRSSSNSNNRGDMLMYESSSDPPNRKNDKDGSSSTANMWSALASTERWISETLASSARVGPDGKVENPYTRKEVSYVCETSHQEAMIVSGIFRRLRESRELGETHGSTQEDLMLEQGESYSPRTMRQTQVVVLSSSDALADSFLVFDKLIQVINQARRNARDYVTDHVLEKLDDKDSASERDWVISVNCAHLHPKFGEKTSQQVLEEMQQEENEGEVDMNLKAYKERREAARRSPFPTVVIEVMATPPPDFGNSPPPSKVRTHEDDKVTSEDVQRLEALFGKSAAMDHPSSIDSFSSQEDNDDDSDDDAFYAAIGRATGISEISVLTPIILAQNWVAHHDEAFDATTNSAFTVTHVTHVDAAHEFVFGNLAMQESSQESMTRQYMVMANFCSSSATSFEKFAMEVEHIISALPSIQNKVKIVTFHPEHVDKNKRSPVPILAVDWD